MPISAKDNEHWHNIIAMIIIIIIIIIIICYIDLQFT